MQLTKHKNYEVRKVNETTYDVVENFQDGSAILIAYFNSDAKANEYLSKLFKRNS